MQRYAARVEGVDFRQRHITVASLVRVAALILLFGMIPRVATAIPLGSALCWAEDHLVLDCHAPVDPPDCGDEPAPGDSGTPEPCFDLVGTAIGVAPASSTPQLDRPEFTLAPWPAIPARPISSIGGQAEPFGQPPWRCDGFHSRCISRLC
jgi:hypothetical protein